MASTALIRAALPSEPELQSFACAAAQLLIDRQARVPGARTVARRAGIGIQHFDHRDYAPGDDVRHIDWRQTARFRRPIVRRFESESVSDWSLLVDASSSMAVHEAAKARAAVRMAAALAYALLHLGHRVEVLAFGGRVVAHCPRGRGQHHYAEIARLLTALRPPPSGERSELGVCVRHVHGAASAFVVGDFLADDEMCRDLGALRQRCTALHAMQVSDGAETRLVEAGEFDLVDVETASRMHAVAGEHANESATRKRAAMTGRLESFCARSGVAFSDWDVSRPWQPVLLAHLLRARSHC